MATKKLVPKKVDKLEKQFMDSKFPLKGAKKPVLTISIIPMGKVPISKGVKNIKKGGK
jgi:hypothetical protein